MWRHVASVGGLTLLSRLFGFVRDVVMAAMIGAGPLADAFMVAFRLPNHFRAIFAEGAFNAAFLPRYAAALEQDGVERARRFAGAVLTIVVLVQLALLALALLAMPWLVSLLAPGFREDPAQFALTIDLTRITFPYLALIAAMTLVSAMLNAHGRFAAAAAAPILLNICMIAALGLSAFFPTAAHALAWGVVAAGVAELLLVYVALRRAGQRIGFARPRLDGDMRRFLKAFGPATLGSAGTQLAMFADTIIASFLPAGSVSYLYYADRLYQLPLAVVGIAVGIVLLPNLSRQVAAGNEVGARYSLNRAIEGILVLTLPCVAVFLMAAEPVVAALFARGAFDAAATQGAASALQAYAVGLVAIVVLRALTPGFHARGDTATPVKALAVAITVNIALKLVLIGPLAHAGLALATAIGACVNALLLGWLLWRIGAFAPDRRLVRVGLLAVAGTFALAAILSFEPMFNLHLGGLIPILPGLAPLAAMLGLGALVYAGVIFIGWRKIVRDAAVPADG